MPHFLRRAIVFFRMLSALPCIFSQSWVPEICLADWDETSPNLEGSISRTLCPASPLMNIVVEIEFNLPVSFNHSPVNCKRFVHDLAIFSVPSGSLIFSSLVLGVFTGGLYLGSSTQPAPVDGDDICGNDEAVVFLTAAAECGLLVVGIVPPAAWLRINAIACSEPGRIPASFSTSSRNKSNSGDVSGSDNNLCQTEWNFKVTCFCNCTSS